MIRYLAEHGANIQANATVALEKALECGNIEIIKILEDYCPEEIVAFPVDFTNISADKSMTYKYQLTIIDCNSII